MNIKEFKEIKARNEKWAQQLKEMNIEPAIDDLDRAWLIRALEQNYHRMHKAELRAFVLQAGIDALMLEYCPDETTDEQMKIEAVLIFDDVVKMSPRRYKEFEQAEAAVARLRELQRYAVNGNKQMRILYGRQAKDATTGKLYTHLWIKANDLDKALEPSDGE